MTLNLKKLNYKGQNILFLLVISLVVAILLIVSLRVEAEPALESDYSTQPADIIVVQGNSVLSASAPLTPKAPRRIQVIVTAYSSTVWETDEDPFTTAAGTQVRDGIVANNILPFGTKIRIPALYGDKVFVVEDRMSWKKSDYHIDIWFPAYEQAKSFGAKITTIEVLEN